MTCHKYDKCPFTQKKNFYNGTESDHYYTNCLEKGEDCKAAELSDIEFKVLKRKKGEKLWKI